MASRRCFYALVLLVSAASTAAVAHTARPAGAVTSPVPRAWGVTMPGLPNDLTALNTLQNEVGSAPGVDMWYVHWSSGTAFPAAAASTISDGAVPEITWEPWNPADGVAQPAYRLNRISHGAFDSYLQSWANAIRNWGRPVRIRFAHEMNGNWYPWAEGVNGNAPGSYVKAWDHVRSVFAGQGATNVSWVWSPNVPYSGSTALSGLFPGDNQVDITALDGYNFGTSRPGSTWRSFADVFTTGLSQLAALSQRPTELGEVGCSETGGDKAQWITDMWATLAGWHQVRELTWFDYNKQGDFRIDSSTGALSAFRSGLANYLTG